MPSLIPPALDLALLGQEQLRMVLEMSLSLYGLPCQVFHAKQASDSDYERELVPEDEYSSVADAECVVLVGKAGLVGDVTSLDAIVDLEARLDADVILSTFHPLQQ